MSKNLLLKKDYKCEVTPEESKTIQELAFKCGYARGIIGTRVSFIDSKFIVLEKPCLLRSFTREPAIECANHNLITAQKLIRKLTKKLKWVKLSIEELKSGRFDAVNVYLKADNKSWLKTSHEKQSITNLVNPTECKYRILRSDYERITSGQKPDFIDDMDDKEKKEYIVVLQDKINKPNQVILDIPQPDDPEGSAWDFIKTLPDLSVLKCKAKDVKIISLPIGEVK